MKVTMRAFVGLDVLEHPAQCVRPRFPGDPGSDPGRVVGLGVGEYSLHRSI